MLKVDRIYSFANASQFAAGVLFICNKLRSFATNRACIVKRIIFPAFLAVNLVLMLPTAHAAIEEGLIVHKVFVGNEESLKHVSEKTAKLLHTLQKQNLTDRQLLGTLIQLYSFQAEVSKLITYFNASNHSVDSALADLGKDANLDFNLKEDSGFMKQLALVKAYHKRSQVNQAKALMLKLTLDLAVQETDSRRILLKKKLVFSQEMPLYKSEVWKKSLKEFKNYWSDARALQSLFECVILMIFSIFIFMLFQLVSAVILDTLRWFLTGDSKRLVRFSVEYTLRFIMPAVVISFGLFAKKILAVFSVSQGVVNQFVPAFVFITLSSGLLHCLVENYIDDYKSVPKKTRKMFFANMSFMGIIIFFNNLNLYSLNQFFEVAMNEHLHAVINFLWGMFFPVITMTTMPKEFRSKLFSEVLHKGKTYFLLRSAVVILSVFFPVSVFLGYVNLANNMLVNIVQLIILVTGLTYLHKVFNRLFPFVIRLVSLAFLKQGSQVEEGIENANHDSSELQIYWTSVLSAAFFWIVGFVVTLLIFGVPSENIKAFYSMYIIQGIPLGKGNYISVTHLLYGISVFIVIFFGSRVAQVILDKRILHYTRLDYGTKQALKTTLGYIGLTLAVVLSLISSGFDMTALTYIVSGLSVGIGIGMKDLFMNFFCGFILLIERPIKEGDAVELNDGCFGWVKKIRLRFTEVQTFDEKNHIIPNSEFIVKKLINLDMTPMSRVTINISVCHGADLELVEKLLTEVVHETEGVERPEDAGIRFYGYDHHALNLGLRIIVKNKDQGWVKSNINKAILEKFRECGIDVPRRQLDVHMKELSSLKL